MKKLVSTIIFSCILLITGCGNGSLSTLGEPVEPAKRIREDLKVYKNDDPLKVHVVYITVFPNSPGSVERYTFNDINQDEDFLDESTPELPVLFQEGDIDGPRIGYYGYGLTDANASIRIRGRSTRNAPQKSYRINLNNRLGTWFGFDKINLNKHPFDITRFRNKLAFDIMKEVEDMPSVRTKFVHVFIKDLSKGGFRGEFEDYGLFTHVESIDDDYLDSHGLDDKGQVYKAENFFFQDDINLRLRSDNEYSKKKFERVLSIQNGGDHDELLNMISDVNNVLIDIDKVVADNFELNNYLTWLAVNILLDNRDTNSQNFMLYRPDDSDTFYFLPWDYDGAFDYYNQVNSRENFQIADWRLGLANYWSVILHSRFFRDVDNIELLNKRVDELYYELSEMDLPGMIDAYNEAVLPYVTRSPDFRYLYLSTNQRQQEVERLKNILDVNLKRYYDTLERPMPIFLGDPNPLGEYSLFNWDKSYDFQGDSMKYKFELSTTPSFETILYEDTINFNEISVRGLEPGTYYWRVTVIDSKGHTQIAMDEYIDENNRFFHGVGEFILEDRR